MRCRECGVELDESDRLPNGAYQCPECGTINHTASSSRRSPSPWRRKRGNSFERPTDLFFQKHFGLPLWAWLAAALLLVVIVVVILVLTLGGKSDVVEEPLPRDVPVTTVSVQPVSTMEAPSDSPASEATAAPEVAAVSASTGVAENDFVVSFDWAMSYLGYNASLTLTSTEQSASDTLIQNYSYEDWFTLQLSVNAESNRIHAATAIARPQADNNVQALAALVSTLYGFDNTISASKCRTRLEKMIADNSRSYDGTTFTATIRSSDTYTMQVVGKG